MIPDVSDHCCPANTYPASCHTAPLESLFSRQGTVEESTSTRKRTDFLVGGGTHAGHLFSGAKVLQQVLGSLKVDIPLTFRNTHCLTALLFMLGAFLVDS